MARAFSEGRGKALSVSGLGYPLGEGLLPMMVVLLIHAVGWRVSWGLLAAAIALLLLPAMSSCFRGDYFCRQFLGARICQESGVRICFYRNCDHRLIGCVVSSPAIVQVEQSRV
jgi:MFS family permease